MTRPTGHGCLGGWVCEKHPDRPWPHDGCAGSVIPCEFPDCSFVTGGKPRLSREQEPLVRALAPHANTIRKWAWVFVSVMGAAAVVAWVGIIWLLL